MTWVSGDKATVGWGPRLRRLAAILFGALVALGSSAMPAAAATQTFTFTGGEQTFTVPAGVSSVHVLAVGAPGGIGSGGSSVTGSGGRGGQVTADLPVSPGQTLFVEVGGPGADGLKMAGGGSGGFNGGGSSNDGGFNEPGGGGGGASDVRTCSRLAASCVAAPNTLASRLLVAAGGGGGGSLDSTSNPPAGGGGGDAGADGQTGESTVCTTGSTPGAGGKAGTQVAGGVGGLAGNNGAPAGNPGILGQGGGAGTGGSNSEPGGGGGGGLYGGGAGGSANGCAGGGGGGGSLLVPAGGSAVLPLTPAPAPQVQISYVGPSPPAPTKATISSLHASNSTFRVGKSSTPLTGQTSAKRHKQGTTFSFRLDQAATVKIAIKKKTAGRRVGRKCRPPTRKLHRKPRCTRTVTIVTLTRTAHAGLNNVAFTGRLRGRPLKPSRYTAVFTAIDDAGASPSKTLTFRIVKR